MAIRKKTKRGIPSQSPLRADSPRAIKETIAQNRKRFAEAVHKHLAAVGWNQKALAKKAKISDGQISGWLASASTSGRVVTQGMVCRVAYALAGQYDEIGHARLGIEQHDAILNELLDAAGFSAIPGREDNSLWAMLSGKFQNRTRSDRFPIRVGWFRWARFADEDFQGPSRDLTEIVAAIMGMTVQPVLVSEIEDLGRMVASREVDLLAPLLVVPTRMFNMAFSDPIEHMMGGLNFLVHERHIPPETRNKVACNESQPTLEDIDPSKIRINYVLGGVAEFIRPHFYRKDTWPPEAHATIEQAVNHVLSSPIDPETDAIRVFCADHFICRDQQIRNSTRGAKLLLNDPPLNLSIVFGVNAHEQGLLNVINQSLKFINNAVIRDIQEKYPQVFPQTSEALATTRTST